jgi:predicted nucleic acid-binding protein
MPVFYADASALVKLVRDEPESAALRAYLDGADLVSCELVLAEVPRAVRRAAAQGLGPSLDLLLKRTEELIGKLALCPVDRGLLVVAGALAEPALRTLDAIHVAAAANLGLIAAFVTYDERQAAAARLAGLRTIAPGGLTRLD